MQTDEISVMMDLFEVNCCAGEAPWEELTNPWSIMSRVCFMGDRPEIPSGVPVTVSQLIEDCWSQDFRDRPTAQEVLSRCKDLLDAL